MDATRAAVPSWLISLVLHLVLILVLGLTLRLTPPRGTAAERTAEVGIVLKQQSGDEQLYIGQEDIGQESSEAAADAAAQLAELFSDTPPTDPSDVLPSSLAVIGPGALPEGGLPSAIGAETATPGQDRGIGGQARTGVFGIEAEGHKFVYVFDRSGSMSGSGRSPLSAAKAELIASLESLDETHQFQIIFYNETPRRFSPTGQSSKLFFATERNKTLAAKFVRSITASGSTRHEQALMLALRLQPDVIFFLTDADEPKLSGRELAHIRRLSGGIAIHAIEFGLGPQHEPDNFLIRLARENNGKHQYVNVTKLGRTRQP